MDQPDDIYQQFEQPKKPSTASKWLYRGYVSVFGAGLIIGAATVAYQHFNQRAQTQAGKEEASQLKETYLPQIVTGEREEISTWTWDVAAHDSNNETFTALIVTESDISYAQTYDVDIVNGQPQLTPGSRCELLTKYVERRMQKNGQSSLVYDAVTKAEGGTEAETVCETVAGKPRLVIKKPGGQNIIFDTELNRSPGKTGL